MGTTTMQRVYVWELPVRFYHWINFLCVSVLIATGFVIGRPLSLQVSGEAAFGYWFGTVRFIHFVTAFIFFFNFLFRIYWGFVGNTLCPLAFLHPLETEPVEGNGGSP